MKAFLNRLRRDRRGVTLIEFAIAAPVLILLIVGFVQLGIILEARAGLNHAVGEGARLATIYPRPTDTQIISAINARRFGLDPAKVTGPLITHGTSNGISYADITMSYNATLDFVFFQSPEITLESSRRAFLH